MKASIAELKSVKTQFDDLHKKLDKTSTNLCNIDENIEATGKSVKKFAELFNSDDVTKSAEGFSSSLAKQTALHFKKTVKEDEDRGNNIIMFGVTEQTDEDAEARKSKDVKFFQDMCMDALEIEKIPVKNIVRIGKKSDKTRPLKVMFGTAFEKRKFMASLRKLNGLDEENPFKKVSINHDLSPDQRDSVKKLLSTAYERNKDNTDADFLWKVRGPPWNQQLVKITKKT